jgi:hypothetical protein
MISEDDKDTNVVSEFMLVEGPGVSWLIELSAVLISDETLGVGVSGTVTTEPELAGLTSDSARDVDDEKE